MQTAHFRPIYNMKTFPASARMEADTVRARENARKTREAAGRLFPHERWVGAQTIKLAQEGPDFAIPNGVGHIKVAKSRVTPSKKRRSVSDNDARTLAKEIRQAKVLADKDASIFILPKMKAADGAYIHGPDALVNGTLYEFKTITGSIDKVERRFRESREQGQNVFIRILNPDISRQNVIRKMYNVVNDPKYTGGFEGSFVFSVRQGRDEIVYRMKIKDLKR